MSNTVNFAKYQANLKVGPIIPKMMVIVNYGSQWTSWANRAATMVRVMLDFGYNLSGELLV
jgi:hypothetical protein